ncbi:GlxA family transcriptional regulator [Mangrovibacter yixingensis]|uniref:GlxA family transcriptional regulator n=1 Tax=Mangrovibacter yixingensis TaxID=1529639 RepID=UPI001CFD47C0|nr:helix-turn-helix domain-containing protein [Mangrovibacter yixingensis]
MAVDVWFVVLPGVLALDLTGPAETFGLAGEAFRLHYIGPQPEVVSSIGLTLGGIAPLPDTLPPGSLLVIPGVADSSRNFSTPEAEQVRRWLTRQQPAIHHQQLALLCICSGALMAARAGLLHQRQCTTHHDVIARLKQAAPDAQVKTNRIFVVDRGVWTSAGITSGIDVSLHLISHLCGPHQALEVAREMVVWFRRAGDDPQLSPWLRYRNHLHPALHLAQDLLSSAPQQAWSVSILAEQVHVSARHLARLFHEHLGVTVRDYIEQLRLALADQYLRQGLHGEQVALKAGFSSRRQWQRALLRVPANSPTAYGPPTE